MFPIRIKVIGAVCLVSVPTSFTLAGDLSYKNRKLFNVKEDEWSLDAVNKKYVDISDWYNMQVNTKNIVEVYAVNRLHVIQQQRNKVF